MIAKLQETVQFIVAELEQEIIFGHLRPHEPLMEDVMMRRFDAKRHVIRQAIAALVERGVAAKEPSRSARVRFYSAEEVDQIYQLRVGLFLLAVDLISFPVSPTLIAELIALQKAHRDAVGHRDLLAIHDANDMFHSAMLNACGNTYIMDAVRQVELLSMPIRSYGIGDIDVMQNSIDEHSRMIKAVQRKDRSLLRELVAQHVAPGKNVYLRSLGGVGRLQSATASR